MSIKKAPECRYNLTNMNIKKGDKVRFTTEQTFTCIGFDKTPHGAEIIKWQAPCLSCGVTFEQTTGTTVIGHVNRRCTLHRKAKAEAAERVEAVEVVKKEADGLPPIGARRPEAISDWLTLSEMQKIYDECGADRSRNYKEEAKSLMYQRQREMLY